MIRASRTTSPPGPEADVRAAREPVAWDAELFLRFETERTRAARDLVAAVSGDPRFIYDLGCGAGAGAALLADRFPEAKVVGVDSSGPMLEVARRRRPGLTFDQTDIGRWRPKGPVDLIYSDSALQWVPDHPKLFQRLMGHLSPGGELAVEMPDIHQEPAHVLMRLLAADGPWMDRLVPVAKTRAVISSHADYYNWLRPLSASLEMWRTTYIHPLAGVEAVLDWFRGTALLPFLAPLNLAEREEFLMRYRRDLTECYPPESDGRVLFLIPRLFIVARKPK